jgi:hypothetical protein
MFRSLGIMRNKESFHPELKRKIFPTEIAKEDTMTQENRPLVSPGDIPGTGVSPCLTVEAPPPRSVKLSH